MSVDELEIAAADHGSAALQKVAHVILAFGDQLEGLLDDLLLLGLGVVQVELVHAGLPVVIED